MKITKVCEQFLFHCQHNRQLSHHSIAAYTRDLNCFVKFTQTKELKDCGKQEIKNYLTYLNQQGYAKKTIKRRIACLKSMFHWLELEETIEINPFHKVDISFKLPQQLPRNIPKTELVKILSTAKKQLSLKHNTEYQLADFTKTVQTPRDLNLLTSLLVIELLFSTGIRVGELVNIQLEHIHLNEHKIRILGKGQRERFVFLADIEIFNLLSAYISLRTITEPNHTQLLVNSRGKPASTHYIRKLIKQLTEKANIERTITPHMYRHSAACQFLESGLDIRYVQRLLGHQSISTTELYTHVNDKVLQNKVNLANVRGVATKK